MNEGASSIIEYTWTDGIPRFANFQNTDVSNPGTPFQSTVDPKWYVWHKNDGNNGDFEWLNYLTLDGSVWSAKLHCQYGPQNLSIPLPWIDWNLEFQLQPGEPHIKCWFEHKPYPDGQSHDDIVIRFLTWDRTPWEAKLNVLSPPFPAQPNFVLRRL